MRESKTKTSSITGGNKTRNCSGTLKLTAIVGEKWSSLMCNMAVNGLINYNKYFESFRHFYVRSLFHHF